MIPKVETTFFFFPPWAGALKCHRSDWVVGSVFFWRARWGSGGGKAEDFTAFMVLWRLNSLPVFSLEGEEKQSWHAKIVETSYSGNSKWWKWVLSRKSRHDCGADTLGSSALLVSHDFKFQHICKVVVIKIVRMGMLQILIANRLQDVTAKVETELFLVYSVSLLLFSWLPCQLN